jgi:hypothetical protein
MRSIRTRQLFNTDNPVASGPIVWGSRRASQMISDLAAGTDSLDIVLIGDSNTMSASSFTWGYVSGMSQAMKDFGWTCYGTAVYPAMTDRGTTAAYGGWLASAYLSAPTGNLTNGNSATSTTYYTNWTPGSTWVRYLTDKDSWAYVASGSYTDNYNAVELQAAHPLNVNGTTLYHRVRYGTFTTSGGQFQGRTREYTSGTVLGSGSVQSTNNASYAFNAYEYSFTANGIYMNSSWSGLGATGPVAIHSHSIYKRSKGWAVTSHGYFSGSTSATIDSRITSIGSTQLQNHLRELRERQILAGGTGRVLLMVHSGINGNETTADWTACHKDIWNYYKAAWSALGYPGGDLAIVSWVSVPRNSDDSSLSGAAENLVGVRDAAKAMALANPDMTVIDVKSIMNYAIAITGVGNGTTYYQGGGTATTQHLSGGYSSGGPPSGTKATSDGYTVTSAGILNALRWNA